jgi:hypothetical protein
MHRKGKPKRPYPRWQRRYESVLQWMMEHPTQTLLEGAQATGYCPQQLSRITCSPDFRRHHRALRAKLEQELLAHMMVRLTLPHDSVMPASAKRGES